jgi:hypothetical protein
LPTASAVTFGSVTITGPVLIQLPVRMFIICRLLGANVVSVVWMLKFTGIGVAVRWACRWRLRQLRRALRTSDRRGRRARRRRRRRPGPVVGATVGVPGPVVGQRRRPRLDGRPR